MTTASTPTRFQAAQAEISTWFFEDYLPRWVKVAETKEDPSFILEYWAAPLYVAGDWTPTTLAVEGQDVVDWLKLTFERLQAAGYSHTVVPDSRIVVFNDHGAAIDVIWSRRRGDESEIERLAVHFVIARRENGLRVIAIETTFTDADTIDEVWPVTYGARP